MLKLRASLDNVQERICSHAWWRPLCLLNEQQQLGCIEGALKIKVHNVSKKTYSECNCARFENIAQPLNELANTKELFTLV